MLIHWFILARFYPISDYSSYNTIFKLPNWLSGENLWYLQAYGCFILVILPILKLFERKLTRKNASVSVPDIGLHAIPGVQHISAESVDLNKDMSVYHVLLRRRVYRKISCQSQSEENSRYRLFIC